MNETNETVELTAEDAARVEAINAKVHGWSGNAHYLFFKAVLNAKPPALRVLILGVYHGRDIAYLIDLLKTYHAGRAIEIVGVDRFTADPCADWTPSKEVRTWETEVHAPPPNLEVAQANTADPRVRLIKSDDFQFLETTGETFDVLYLDTAHDFNTVIRQLRQVRRIAKPGALICGDDYSDRHTWGVKSAVQKGFGENHRTIADWIWHARIEDLKGIQ